MNQNDYFGKTLKLWPVFLDHYRIYRLIGQNHFPRHVKIGSRSIAFVESEIDAWINQRIAESREEVA